MRSKIVGLCMLAAVFLHTLSYAQSDSIQVKKITYYNSFVSGALIGCGFCNEGKDFTFSFLTQHGISLSSGLKFSLGVGMDVYSDWRLFPVVAGFTLDFNRKENSLYLHVNAGHAWGRYLLNGEYWGAEITEQGGFTFNPMLGYRIGTEKIRLYIQVGYKFQRAYIKETYDWGSSSSRDYELNRVVVQFGFGFN